jgi:thymidylate synthase
MRPGQKFTHTYMERFWPKVATDGLNPVKNRGIRYELGDFRDVINLLKNEPFTRQAFLPIWFPEDTGAVHGGRVPCTLGYHFIRRHNYLHLIYYIRSCDFFRHFNDDVYMACRLVHYIIRQLFEEGSWANVSPGTITMHITSLHIFNQEKGRLEKWD